MRLTTSGFRPVPKPSRFVVEHRGHGVLSCLPEDLSTEYLLEITTITDCWAKYIDTRTGAVHDSAEYHKQMLKEQED